MIEFILLAVLVALMTVQAKGDAKECEGKHNFPI